MAALLLPSALAAWYWASWPARPLTAATVDLRSLALAAVALAVPGLLLRWRPLLVVGIAVGAVAVGAWRGAAVALPTGDGSVAAMVGSEERALTGTAIDDPRPRGERQQVVIDRVEAVGRRRIDHRARGTRPALAAAQRRGGGRRPAACHVDAGSARRTSTGSRIARTWRARAWLPSPAAAGSAWSATSRGPSPTRCMTRAHGCLSA